MNVVRPCLACGLDNTASAIDCSRCGVALVTHAAGSAPSSGSVMPSRRRATGSLVGALVIIAAGVGFLSWWLLTRPEAPPQPALRWEEPQAVEAWASEFLATRGVAATSLKAQVIEWEGSSRRILTAQHPPEQPSPRILRAVARMLVAARAEGAESAAHLALVSQGERRWSVPIGEAATLSSEPRALAALLGLTEEELHLDDPTAAHGAAGDVPPEPPLHSDDPDATPSGSADPAPAPGPPAPQDSSGGPTDESVAAGGPSRRAPNEPPPTIRAMADGPPARVARGNGAMQSRGGAGLTLPAFRLQVAAGVRRRLTLRSLTLKASGTLPDVEDISFVDLLRETDVSGRRATRPEKLGERQSFTDEDGAITFSGLDVPFGEDGLPLALVVQVELPHALEGGTFDLALPDEASIELENSDGETVRVIGVPVRGPLITVEGTIVMDTEQERLDALAEAGPDVPDVNAERLQREAAERAASESEKPAEPAPAGVQPDASKP